MRAERPHPARMGGRWGRRRLGKCKCKCMYEYRHARGQRGQDAAALAREGDPQRIAAASALRDQEALPEVPARRERLQLIGQSNTIR